MANCLTRLRALLGLLILFFPAFSPAFFIFYLIGGLTDAVDGTVARRLGKDTAFGAVFDTTADAVFALTVTAKIVSALIFPTWLLIWIGVIILVKAVNAAAGLIKYRRIVTVHSLLNKLCGLAVFCVPLFIGGSFAWQARFVLTLLVCGLATVAALREGWQILSGKVPEYY